jgi:hypothetical protein
MHQDNISTTRLKGCNVKGHMKFIPPLTYIQDLNVCGNEGLITKLHMKPEKQKPGKILDQNTLQTIFWKFSSKKPIYSKAKTCINITTYFIYPNCSQNLLWNIVLGINQQC